MSDSQGVFPTRVLRLSSLESLEAGEPVDPGRINQHIEGQPNPTRAMSDEEISTLLNDPLAMLVLRSGIFPQSLDELLAALDAHNGTPEGLPEQASFLVAEGGQIRFQAGVNKGGSRLITVRGRNNSPELMISTLVPPGVSPRARALLNEVIAWDPINRTFHFYQRQANAWFWCGQSDMALVAPTRGEGPFDSHVNGYVVLKELKTPWVHWHGPGVGIAETAYAPDDPLVSDPLFIGKDHALNFEQKVIRPLAERWNDARFSKAVDGGTLKSFDQYARQILDSSSANLISTHKEWSQIDTGGDLDDVPVTFFVDVDCLIDSKSIGLPVTIPPLRLTRARYKSAVDKHKLKVADGQIDIPGDVPFCFTVPERALEDVLALQILLRNNVLSPRLAAALLMVDFSNPVNSPVRNSLLAHLPASVDLSEPGQLDEIVVDRIKNAAATRPDGSPEHEFTTNWDLGADDWTDTYADRIEAYLAAVSQRLDTDDGADDVFRLAESRRREFRKRPLAEFGLSLPRATGIPATAPILEMTADAQIQPRTS